MAVVTKPPNAEVWLVDLYRERYRPLVRLAALLVDDVALAEEVVQDAFVATARRRAKADVWNDEATPAYLRSAVINGARSQLRKRRVRRNHLRSVSAPEGAPPADVGALRAAETDQVMAALARLPERQRQVLILRYYEDLSEAEIATALDISTGSVKTHAHRGMAALSTLLADTDREGQ